MKVFQIFTSFPEKYQPYNKRLIDGLLKEKTLEIKIITEKPSSTSNDYLIHSLSKDQNPLSFFVKKIGGLWNSYWIKRGLKTSFKYKIFPKYNFIKKNKKSLFHFHKIQSIPFPLLDYMITNEIKYLVSLRGYDITIFPLISDSNNGFVKKVLRNAHKIHSVCENLKEEAISLANIDNDKIKVIYRTPNIKDLTTAPILDIMPEVVNIFALSRIHWKKCIAESLMTIKRLKEKEYSIKYHIIGGFQGYENEKLLYLIKSLKLEDDVKLYGYLPESEYNLLLKNMHIFWMPSVNEGIPNSLYYVLKSGFPVIAAKTNGIPEIIKDEDNGLLFEPYDFNDLLDKTESLIINNELRKNIQQRARETKLQTLENEVELYVNLYLE